MDSIATIFFSNAIAVGLVGWLLKLWVDKRLALAFDRELERFKSELAKDVARDSIQQKWVNEKRVKLFGQLYELMVEMDSELKALFLNIKVQSHEFTKERAERFCERYTALNATLHKNEIFLNAEIVSEIRGIYKPFFDTSMECLREQEGAFDDFRNELPETMEEISAAADEPRKKVVRIFREVAGIDS